MKISPQDDARRIAATAEVNRASIERLQQNRAVNNKSSLEKQMKKVQSEQDKFVLTQLQKLLDGIYSEKSRQNAAVIKGTNVDVYA